MLSGRAPARSRALWSHEETGNGWTYRRDRRVAAWCRDSGHPLARGAAGTALSAGWPRARGWAGKWDRLHGRARHVPPRELAPLRSEPGAVCPSAGDLGLAPDPCAPDRQPAGGEAGLDRLESFLALRGAGAIAAPCPRRCHGATACSRLSPAPGLRHPVDARGVAQATWQRQHALKAGAPGRIPPAVARRDEDSFSSGCTGTATSCRSSRTSPKSSIHAQPASRL